MQYAASTRATAMGSLIANYGITSSARKSLLALEESLSELKSSPETGTNLKVIPASP